MDRRSTNFTLMAVHAHPDEANGTGGILAKYAAEGIRTILVYWHPDHIMANRVTLQNQVLRARNFRFELLERIKGGTYQ